MRAGNGKTAFLAECTKIFGFAYRNLIFAKRNFFTFFEILFWPFITVISIGLMGVFLDFKGNVMNFILTGTLTSGMLQVTQLDVAYSLLYDVWSKSTKHTFLSPISHFHYIAGGWLVGIIRGMLVFGAMYAFSSHYFRFTLPPAGVTTVFLAGVFLNALLLGMIVSVLIFFFGQKVDIVAWSAVALVMLFCGIYYPIDTLPPWARNVAAFIPLTYFLDYFRAGYGFTPVFTHGLWKGFAGVLLYGILFLRLIELAYCRARRTGMILRISE